MENPTFAIVVGVGVVLLFTFAFEFLLNERRKRRKEQDEVWNILERVRLALGQASESHITITHRVDFPTLTLSTPRVHCEFLFPTNMVEKTADETAGFTRSIEGAITSNDEKVAITFCISRGGQGDSRGKRHHGVRYLIEHITMQQSPNSGKVEGNIDDGSAKWPFHAEIDQIFHEVARRMKYGTGSRSTQSA